MASFHRAILVAMLAAATVPAAAGAADKPIALRWPRDLGPAIAALPRLVARPGDHAAAAINHALAADDTDARNAAADCRATGKQHSDFSRSVQVTMRGPRYFSVTATRSWYCGGAYPDWSTAAFVYDLASGAAVDWQKLLPASLVDGTTDYTTPGDGIASAALTKLYIPAATDDADCRNVLTTWQGGLGFLLWPDAAADGIALAANNLPHVVKACGPPVTIGTAQLRGLGVDAALLDAIDAAHANGWYQQPPAKH